MCVIVSTGALKSVFNKNLPLNDRMNNIVFSKSDKLCTWFNTDTTIFGGFELAIVYLRIAKVPLVLYALSY